MRDFSMYMVSDIQKFCKNKQDTDLILDWINFVNSHCDDLFKRDLFNIR